MNYSTLFFFIDNEIKDLELKNLVTQLNQVKWPDEVDFKGAIHGNLWHFYQISLNKTKMPISFIVCRVLTSAT